MSEKPAEYLKRTCLICGCHTNQTINIYEPRSGPNIVELIQAKFKFQPLNEDKYLCFSCNNWLINWHSLQAVNSNDAESESPSGTFRSHMNSMVQEKGAGSQHQPEVIVSRRRPIAQVRPRQLAEAEAQSAQIPEMREQLNATSAAVAAVTKSSSKAQNYTKRSFRLNHRLRQRIQHKSMRACCVCGRAIVVRMRANLNSKAAVLKRSSKCRKCREVCQWHAITARSLGLAKAARMERMLRKSFKTTEVLLRRSLVNTQTNNVNSQNNAQENNQSQEQQERRPLQRPLVDGKVVSMLRRLGTTLSREPPQQHKASNAETFGISHRSNDVTSPLPQIMSPAKQKPRWTRQLEDDEILLDFDTAISEVLPTVASEEGASKQVRRKLAYQVFAANEAVAAVERSGTDVEGEGNLYNLLPKGLSISLV